MIEPDGDLSVKVLKERLCAQFDTNLEGCTQGVSLISALGLKDWTPIFTGMTGKVLTSTAFFCPNKDHS